MYLRLKSRGIIFAKLTRIIKWWLQKNLHSRMYWDYLVLYDVLSAFLWNLTRVNWHCVQKCAVWQCVHIVLPTTGRFSCFVYANFLNRIYFYRFINLCFSTAHATAVIICVLRMLFCCIYFYYTRVYTLCLCSLGYFLHSDSFVWKCSMGWIFFFLKPAKTS